MRNFHKNYVFEIDVDDTYNEVHNYFKHQTVFIRYTCNEDRPNTIKVQPDPMVPDDAKIIERDLKRIGARFSLKPPSKK